MIDAELKAFLEDAVGIHLGTRSAELEPNGCRAVAAAVEDGGERLVVYVAAVAAERVLPDLEANGQAAVSFGRPVDERACQVKGVFEGAREAREDEKPRVSMTAIQTVGIKGYDGFAVALVVEADMRNNT